MYANARPGYPGVTPFQRLQPKGFTVVYKAILICSVGVAAVALLVFLMSKPWHGSSPSAFLSALHDAGFYNEGDGSEELANGQKVCDWLSSAGASHTSAAYSLSRTNANLSHVDAPKFVDIADAYLC